MIKLYLHQRCGGRTAYHLYAMLLMLVNATSGAAEQLTHVPFLLGKSCIVRELMAPPPQAAGNSRDGSVI